MSKVELEKVGRGQCTMNLGAIMVEQIIEIEGSEYAEEIFENIGKINKSLHRDTSTVPKDITASSMNKLCHGLEVMTRRNMKICVVNHLMGICLTDTAFAEKVMNPDKSVKDCFQYIYGQAKKYMEAECEREKMEGFDIPDDLCYEWAVEYFNSDRNAMQENCIPVSSASMVNRGKKPEKREDSSKTKKGKEEGSTSQLSLSDMLEDAQHD